MGDALIWFWVAAVSWLRKKGPADEAHAVVTREIPLCGIGHNVTVGVQAVQEEHDVRFPARVGAVDGDTIVLTGTRGMTAASGTRITVHWCVESGERWVPATVEATNELTWTVRAAGEVTHEQRRGSVRIETAVPVRIRRRDGSDSRDGTTVNLSCGGVAAIIDAADDEDLPVAGEDLDLELDLPSGTVTVAGAVLEIRPSEHGQKVRITFAAAPACHQQFAQYVFQVQREELARRRRVRG